ncbi:MAG: hypothetical protein VX529_11035 [Pseudomonadota bacterium]|nr:hypothetical protein [Pseudomonadota bacterium]
MPEQEGGPLQGWHLDKRVPLALIVALIAQTASVIWWGASINERVNTLESQVTGSQEIRERLVRIETILDERLGGN